MVGGELSKRQPEQLPGAGGVKVCDPGAVAALTQLPHQSRHKRRRQRHHPPVPSSLPVTQPHPSASSTNRPNHPCMGAPSCENEQQLPEQAHRGRGQLPHPGRIPGHDDQLGAPQLPQCSAGVVCSNTGPEGCCSTSCAEGEAGFPWPRQQLGQPGHQAHRQQRKRQRKAPGTTARQPSDSSGSSGSVGNAAGDSDCGSNSPD
ncbi:hypothetical protein HaLaN_13008, partial [Haematococcus lacustris]